jgi:hypothetical protein
MAGLEPSPSLLDADPEAPIRFAATARATAPAVAASGGAAAPPEAPGAVAAGGEPAPDPAQVFPTVGQFARSKLGRSRRARRAERDDHGGGPHIPPAPPLPPEDHPYKLEDELHADEPEEPVEPEQQYLADEEPAEVAEVAPEHELEHHLDYEPEPGLEPELEHEPEPEHEPVAYPPPVPVAAPETRAEDTVALLLPAVAIPVIVTSVAGWRFGLSFVALSVIATGILLGRRSGVGGGKGPGLIATLRGSPATGLVLKTTAAVTVLSVIVSVLLASAGKTSTSTTADKPVTPAKKPASRAPAATPTTPAAPAHKPKRKHARNRAATTGQAAPDPGTAGLVRVPPKSASQTHGTGPNGTGTPTTGTTTTPSTGAQGGTSTTP